MLEERGTPPDAGPDASGDRIDIDAALARIPEEFRVAVVLRDLCDLDYAQIADVLDLPPGTVRSRIARGRAAVALELRTNPRPGEPGAAGSASNGALIMNEPPISPEPPDGFDLDEALNALVDDELAGFAADHGLTEAAVRERLEATPNLAARACLARADPRRGPARPLRPSTMSRATDSCAMQPERDPTTSRPRRGSRRWIAVTAIAAAGLLVVAGIGVAVSSISGDSSTSSSSSDSGASSTAPSR